MKVDAFCLENQKWKKKIRKQKSHLQRRIVIDRPNGSVQRSTSSRQHGRGRHGRRQVLRYPRDGLLGRRLGAQRPARPATAGQPARAARLPAERLAKRAPEPALLLAVCTRGRVGRRRLLLAATRRAVLALLGVRGVRRVRGDAAGRGQARHGLGRQVTTQTATWKV